MRLRPQGDKPESIGIRITAGKKTYTFSFPPEEALELAARLADMYAKWRGYSEASSEGDGSITSPPDRGLSVESWRLKVLLDAGYPAPLAEAVARSDADLHRAADMVLLEGCDPETAAAILT